MPQPVVLQNDMVLQNKWIRAVVVPAEGGRVASLRSLHSGIEFLFQSVQPFQLKQPGRDAAFEQGACAGIEECLPTVAPCTVDGELIPDHGDFWQLAWDVLPSNTSDNAEALLLRAVGFSRPLRFTKKVLLRERCLRLEYAIENIGGNAASFLYAAHPLLAIESGDRIVLPQQISWLTLHHSKDGRLGSTGDRIAWPLARHAPDEPALDLSLLTDSAAATAEMLYTEKLHSGRCGLYRAQQQQGIIVRFDTAQLPYLGLWICCGGWPESGSGPKQYAFAPEPTLAPCGSLADAIGKRLAVSLQPGEELHFAIEFCITQPGISLHEFSRSLAE